MIGLPILRIVRAVLAVVVLTATVPARLHAKESIGSKEPHLIILQSPISL